jgi:hypothetical protein
VSNQLTHSLPMGDNCAYTTVTHKSLHEALCSDGDDACGGPFQHTRNIDELVAAAIANIDAMKTTPASTSITEPAGINATNAAEASSSSGVQAGIDAAHTNAVAADVTKPPVINSANIRAEATAIAKPAAINDGSVQPFEVCITKRPRIKATATKPGRFQRLIALAYQHVDHVSQARPHLHNLRRSQNQHAETHPANQPCKLLGHVNISRKRRQRMR